jgi:hypothetical protein
MSTMALPWIWPKMPLTANRPSIYIRTRSTRYLQTAWSRRESKTGELFDRTAAIASESAEFIALAAQSLGQDDDVTVLTLTRRLAGERSTGHELLQPRSPALA